MKYLVIILLSFAFFHPALAARAVKGTVPNVQPLQPAPVGVFPAFNKNIESRGPAINNTQAESPASPASAHTEPSFLTAQVSEPGRGIVWLAALLAALIFGWLLYKRNKS
jgi:hypothetical protein